MFSSLMGPFGGAGAEEEVEEPAGAAETIREVEMGRTVRAGRAGARAGRVRAATESGLDDSTWRATALRLTAAEAVMVQVRFRYESRR